ncbi:type I restriction enzyme, S subunit [Geodermatophilus dictyosporus]|uniref:Type I restriction enzyme, S subunit n=1 Tax=Geodermatophilus dictyosporus TaxID=1523247 RepID=A0A1I5RXH5_9ACTN|nr:restriction endonuclease subunit S [Geodermatophilus dictyosporus]SFP63021.1 type I restriction enzyme, S subunit [Geodermatophilus dictyosporus]
MTSTWATSTVGEQFDVQLGKMLDAAKNVGVPKPYLGNRAVQWGRIDVSAGGVVPMSRADIQRYRLRDGDLLVCEGGEVGRGAIWRNELAECYFQKALHRLRAKHGYDVRLMQALLAYWSSTGAFADFVTQTSIAHLPREKFIQMPLPLPPQPEQGKIGDVLQDVDDLIGTLERLISKKLAIKQGIMQQLLTGSVRLPGFTEPWREVAVAELLEFKNGLNKASQFFGRGTPIVNFMDVMNGPIITAADVAGRVTLTRDETKRFSARCGDVFFTRTSETIEEVGTAAVLVDDIPDAAFSGFILRGRPRSTSFDSRFLAYLFQLDDVRRQVTASASYTTRALTNGKSLSRVRLLTPRLDEQRAIMVAVQDAEHEIRMLSARLSKTLSVKQGIMQELLTGRTRLPNQVQPA